MLPRPFMLGLIALLTFTLGWVSYDELKRRDADLKHHLQTSENGVQPLYLDVSEPLEPLLETSRETAQPPAPVIPNYQSIPMSTALVTTNTGVLVNNQDLPNTSAIPKTTEEEIVCSSFDLSGLLATFDASLAAFIADASATYGGQYSNLQYQLADKTGAITGEQGTVTTTYSGTVQELSTGEPVSANGVITANFAWDGCVWQLVDYSF
jgi:hypothetical protein